MMTDPIADMLTRIRNAVAVEQPQVEMPMSRVKKGVADALKREGYIWDYQVVTEEVKFPVLRVELKYGPNGEHVVNHIRRVSKPGCRVYRAVRDLRPVLQGLGVCVLSTSKGILSDREARQQGVGGEVLAEIW